MFAPMFHRITTTACLLAFALLAAPAAGRAEPAPTAQEVLAASDTIRNPDRPFSLTTTLTEYRSGKAADRMLLTIYAKADSRNGQYRNLVRFVEPARDLGKLMLRDGTILWFYDPSSKSSVRISPQQRLLGQASNGDVVTVNLSKDYAAELAGNETITDGDKQSRSSLKLDLLAVTEGVTYHRIEYWVDKADYRPIKGKFYSETDRLLKTAYYRRYERQLDQDRPTETIIIDGVDTNLVTRMQYSDYHYREIPEAWFQRESLPRFQAD
jgi:outer membrane lipoprotein-sorting protein